MLGTQKQTIFLKITLWGLLLFSCIIKADLANLTKNDPYPLYSAVYPYDFLARREKIEAFYRHHELYEEDRFRVSISPFFQRARCATDLHGIRSEIGDLPNGIGMNFGALFFDPVVANQLQQLLGINATVTDMASTSTSEQACFNLFRDPTKTDTRKQFGFVSTPIIYKKFGIRLDSEILIIDTCFDAVGLKLQTGLVDVRQTVTSYSDLTCSATGLNCPSFNPNCTQESCCIAFTCDCKRLMIGKITSQKNVIAKFLGIDLCQNYHRIGLEDIRIGLYWRHIYNLNPEEFNEWPRVLFVPFLQIATGIPMAPRVESSQVWGVPIGNNGHTSVGGSAGFTLDFLDTIDIAFEAGATHFFKQKYCNLPLPTNKLESIIHPYKADVFIKPGVTWFITATMHAFHFVDNLSVWVQYLRVDHKQDKIVLCSGNIPPNSAFSPENPLIATGIIPNVSLPFALPENPTPIERNTLAPLSFLPPGDRGRGFLIEESECVTKWESEFLNVGFTYDISPYVNIGVAFQIPLKQRNAYRSGTIIGSITMVY